MSTTDTSATVRRRVSGFASSSTARRRRWGLVGAALACAVCVVLSVLCGAKSIPPADVWTILTLGPGAERGALPTGITPESYGIIWDLRAPRTLVAAVVGTSLGIAGALTQAWTKNPLADPGIIGVNAGAGCAVAIGLTCGLAGTIGERALWGMAGAVLAAAVVLRISRVSRDPLTLVLVGVGVTFALQATMNLLSLYSSDTLEGMRRWAVGSTAGRDFNDAWLALGGLLGGGLLAAVAARPLDMLAMGDAAAQSLGSSPARARRLAAAAVVVLAGTATASVGFVMFLGFAVPHLVRPWTGPALTRMLPAVGLLGATLALAADTVGRFVLQPNELDMAIVIALVGAPLMVAVVRSTAGRKVHG